MPLGNHSAELGGRDTIRFIAAIQKLIGEKATTDVSRRSAGGMW